MNYRIFLAGKILAFLSILFASVCILLWFLFNIKSVYEELTGKSSKKAVADYRKKLAENADLRKREGNTEKSTEVTGLINVRKEQNCEKRF